MKKAISLCIILFTITTINASAPAVPWVACSTSATQATISTSLSMLIKLSSNASCWLPVYGTQAGEARDTQDQASLSMGHIVYNKTVGTLQPTGEQVLLTPSNVLTSQSDMLKNLSGGIDQFFQDYESINLLVPTLAYFPFLLTQPGVGPFSLYNHFSDAIVDSATVNGATPGYIFEEPLTASADFRAKQNYATNTNGPSF